MMTMMILSCSYYHKVEQHEPPELYSCFFYNPPLKPYTLNPNLYASDETLYELRV